MIFKYSILFYILFNFVFPHPVDDPAIWKHYYRGSYIVNEKHDYGLGVILESRELQNILFET